MSRIYRNIIIVISILVVICFAAVMFALYGNFNLKTNNSIEMSEIVKPTIDENIYQSVINETEYETTIDESENISEVDVANSIASTSIDRYKASDNFAKVDLRDKKDVFCFVGDVFLSKKPRAAYDEKGLEGIIDDGYLNILQSSDFNIANLECSITDDTENAEDKTFTFALPTKYVKPLKEVGFNLFTLANNHILDYGIDSMKNTMKVLDENGISHIGVGNNVYDAKKAYIKEIEGKRYAFLGASSVLPSDNWKADVDKAGVFNGYNIGELCEEIKYVRPYVDKVIVYMHWGRELETVSNTWQKQYARRIVDAGADLVVGAHSHMVQEIEYYNDVPIVYSLGNFIYGGTMRDTMLVSATFDYSIDKKGTLQLQIYTGLSNYEKVRRDWKREEILAKINELQSKSSTCYIGDNGYVFTMSQVMEALKSLESPAKIN